MNLATCFSVSQLIAGSRRIVGYHQDCYDDGRRDNSIKHPGGVHFNGNTHWYGASNYPGFTILVETPNP